jgi:hypothetical protein
VARRRSVHQLTCAWAPAFSANPVECKIFCMRARARARARNQNWSHSKPLARRRNLFDFREGQFPVRGSFSEKQFQ